MTGLALLLYACPTLWLAPLQIVITIEGLAPGAQLTAHAPRSPRALTLRAWPLPQDCVLTLAAERDERSVRGDAAIIFGPIVNEFGARVAPAGYTADSPWTCSPGGDRWTLPLSGAGRPTLRWHGRGAGILHMGLLAHPAGGSARVQWDDDAPEIVATYAADEHWLTLERKVPARTVEFTGRLPFDCPELLLRSSAGTAQLRRMVVFWGERALYDSRNTAEINERDAAIALPAVSRAHLCAWALANVGRVILRAAAYYAYCFVVGLPLVALLARRLSPVSFYAATIVAGVALSILAATNLTRLHWTGAGALQAVGGLGAALSVVAVAASICRRGALVQRLLLRGADLRHVALLLIVGVFASLLVFYPLLSFPNWFLGHAYTDSYYYFNVAEAFRRASANALADPAARNAAGVQQLVVGGLGTAERTGDVLGLLSAALCQGTTARAAYAQWHFNHWLLGGLVGYGILTCLAATRWVRWGGFLLLLSSAAFYELFTQCYLAQFGAVVLSIYALWLLVLYTAHAADPGLTVGEHAAFLAIVSAGLAAGVVTYPGQFLLPAALALALIVRAIWARDWRPLAALAVVGALTTTLAASGLAMMLRSGAGQHVAALDALARNIVFPFYREPVFLAATVLGLVDWVGISGVARALASDIGPPAHAAVGLLIKPLLPLRFAALLAAGPLAVLGLRNRSAACSARVLLGATVAVYGVTALALFLAGQLYLPAKLLISLGVLLLPLLLAGLDVAARATAPAARGAALGLLVAFISSNAATIWFDNSVWLLPHRSPVLDRTRTQIAALSHDLLELARYVADRAPLPPGTLVVVGTDDRARGSDRDRILMAHVYQVFCGAHVEHAPLHTVTLQPPVRWVLVFDGYTLPAPFTGAARPRLANATFCLYELAG